MHIGIPSSQVLARNLELLGTGGRGGGGGSGGGRGGGDEKVRRCKRNRNEKILKTKEPVKLRSLL